MALQATLTMTQVPTVSHVSVKIEVQTTLNVSAYVARQKANRFLIVQAGDQLCAGEPELAIGSVMYWRVPVLYAPGDRGNLGTVGQVLVNTETGEVVLADGLTATDLMERAEILNDCHCSDRIYAE